MESDTDKGSDWLDFKDIKARAQVRPVLGYFGILEHLEERGAELVGWCPLGKEHGKADSFAFNTEKRSFQCFACKARGSVLDFIGKYQGVSLREAAKIALEILGDGQAAAPQEERREGKGRPYGKPPALRPEPPRQAEAAPDPRRETGGLLVFTWGHAEFLVQARMLDPARLVVLDVDALATFVKVTVKQPEEKAT
jgi:hypothetical protein